MSQPKPPQPNSPLKQLKMKPEVIATEFVNLTPATAEAFLRKHRWRLLLPTPHVTPEPVPPYLENVRVVTPAIADENGEFTDAREADSRTGEPIEGTERTLKTWKQPEPVKADQAARPAQEPYRITDENGQTRVEAGVERSARTIKRMRARELQERLEKNRKDRFDISRRNDEVTLLKWAALLAGMWTRDGAAEARQAMEQIFAAERPAVWNANLERWSGTLPLERPAIQLSRRGFQFKRRDLLDPIAWTILEASRCGFLRRCKSCCATPLFVASHSRQVYCFECGVKAERRRKREWARKNRAPKRRERAA